MASHTVLIIDDEDSVREVAQMSLELMAGWTVLTASSGSQGIARARTDKPEAILLDVMMPDMDGPTTYRLLQVDATTRDIPVILLTAKAQASDREEFNRLGVTGLITKPFDPVQLPEQVAALLGWKESGT
jgi:two-component system, OmpR family, alkaline phosphatase synthesis response regulator PhoP